jgi:hypothetical protein
MGMVHERLSLVKEKNVSRRDAETQRREKREERFSLLKE